jgi:hypothetical protein
MSDFKPGQPFSIAGSSLESGLLHSLTDRTDGAGLAGDRFFIAAL